MHQTTPQAHRPEGTLPASMLRRLAAHDREVARQLGKR